MSVWEHQVGYNISESGVHALSVRELVTEAGVIDGLLDLPLGYPQTNGTPELRSAVAALYPGATADNVLATTGAAQANFTTLMTLVSPGDDVAILTPNYTQLWGLAKTFNMRVSTFSLNEEEGWALDVDELRRVVTDKTKLIAVCNPNNPTGHIMSIDEMNAVIEVASRVGAWILADEIYTGSERLADTTTPTFWGRYERVLAIGSLSKSYGLPGIRLGWVVAPPEIAEAIWKRQEYVTICSTLLANKLGAYALSPKVRPRLLARGRGMIREGYANFQRWSAQHTDLISWIPPQAGAFVFARYAPNVNSTELVDRLIREQSVYAVPGDHFGIDHYLRFSTGIPVDYLNEALDRVYKALVSAS
jgi:aspartate/methionine/tyrosine aminotransferase